MSATILQMARRSANTNKCTTEKFENAIKLCCVRSGVEKSNPKLGARQRNS